MRLFTAGDGVVAALALLLVAYYGTTRGIFQGKASGDGLLGFLYLPGLVFHGSLDLAAAAPEYIAILGRERTGHVANPVPIGPLLLWLPPYLLGLGIKKVLLGLLSLGLLPRVMDLPPGQPLWVHGPFDYWMAGLGSLVAGVCGVALLFKLLTRHLSRGGARFAVLGAVLATPLCWYVVTQPLYQHAISFFAVALFVERWDAWRAALTTRRAAALGAIAGFMMLVRLQEAIFLLLPGLDLLRELGAGARRRDPRALLCAVGRGLLLLGVAALCFLPQLLVWRYFFGELRAPQAPGHMRWGSPALLETLFSLRSGLFPWMPVLYLALPGLLLGRRWLQGLWAPLSLVFLIEIYVNASAWDYHGCWAFGPRRFTDAAVVIAAGLGGLWERLRGRSGRRALAALLALLVAWNVLLMELLRHRKIKNSAVGAFPLTQWVRWAGGPSWLLGWAGRWGYPLAWPASVPYALLYRMPVTHFEGIVGNYLLERDWRIRAYVLTPSVHFAEAPSYVVSGTPAPPPGGWPAGAAVPAGPELRLIIPLAAREPIRLSLEGEFGRREAEVEVWWNGQRLELAPRTRPGVVVARVPEHLVRTRARLNELRFRSLPPGTRVYRVDFHSFTEWWR